MNMQFMLLPLLAGTGELLAQPAKHLSLARPSAVLDAEFVGVTSVRETADGRVIVTDGRDQTLYLADFSANKATILGQKGKGPGEWSFVGFVHSMGRDSSIMVDMVNRRWLLFDGGRIAATVPPDHPAVRAAGEFIIGADVLGHVMIKAPLKHPPSGGGIIEFTRKDSLALVLIDRKTGRADTIARLRERPRKTAIRTDELGRVRSTQPAGGERYAQAEEAALAPDGWVAVVRLEPLRVDWRSPAGLWTRGPAISVRPDPGNTGDRRVIAEGNLRMTGDERLLIKRPGTEASRTMRWLVINRRGLVDGELTTGPREKVVGFGGQSVYSTSRDADDIEVLRRHSWP